MITINQIEQAVVSLLKAALPKVHTEAYPADVRQFLDTFRPANGALLVQYAGRERKYLARTRGTQVVTVEISAISKNLRDHMGIYPLLDAAFVAVSGVELTKLVNDEPQILGVVLHQKSEDFQTYIEKNGLWVYTQTYESEPFPFLLPETEIEQLIEEITLKTSNTETIIPEPLED